MPNVVAPTDNLRTCAIPFRGGAHNILDNNLLLMTALLDCHYCISTSRQRQQGSTINFAKLAFSRIAAVVADRSEGLLL